MAYSNQTTHYGLPLPVGSDKSTWTDTNEAFEAVDSALYAASQAGSSQSTAVEQLQQQMITANQQIASNAGDISAEVAAREAQDNAHSSAISNINTRLGNTSLAGHGDGTVTGVLNDVRMEANELVRGHVPEKVVLNIQTASTFTVDALDIYTDDYLVYTAVKVSLTTSESSPAVLSNIANSGHYGLLLATIEPAEVQKHFPHIEVDSPVVIADPKNGYVNRGYVPANVAGPSSAVLRNGRKQASLYLYINTAGRGYVYFYQGSTEDIGLFNIFSNTTNTGAAFAPATIAFTYIDRCVKLKIMTVEVPEEI